METEPPQPGPSHMTGAEFTSDDSLVHLEPLEFCPVPNWQAATPPAEDGDVEMSSVLRPRRKWRASGVCWGAEEISCPSALGSPGGSTTSHLAQQPPGHNLGWPLGKQRPKLDLT